ncbi:hypothetical protein VP01_897g2 [Puccinia sorghi]|uniref:Uncharacterized protein n=1 Tax=Puccinia sorghi TaxID=27349 RepID=A0A0L6U7U6_9BASI|nr:hypothetical protein VP01_897g2 [Puccinia sorghi]
MTRYKQVRSPETWQEGWIRFSLAQHPGDVAQYVGLSTTREGEKLLANGSNFGIWLEFLSERAHEALGDVKWYTRLSVSTEKGKIGREILFASVDRSFHHTLGRLGEEKHFNYLHLQNRFWIPNYSNTLAAQQQHYQGFYPIVAPYGMGVEQSPFSLPRSQQPKHTNIVDKVPQPSNHNHRGAWWSLVKMSRTSPIILISHVNMLWWNISKAKTPSLILQQTLIGRL